MKTKFSFLIFFTILFFSCDPENDFYINGKIIDEYSKETIDNVDIEFICYSNSLEWNVENKIKNNRNGKFNDTIASLRRFDSIKIMISKEGYSSKEIKTELAEWEISRGFMKIEFDVNYGIVQLKKK